MSIHMAASTFAASAPAGIPSYYPLVDVADCFHFLPSRGREREERGREICSALEWYSPFFFFLSRPVSSTTSIMGLGTGRDAVEEISDGLPAGRHLNRGALAVRVPQGGPGDPCQAAG